MLLELRVRDLGVVEDVTVPFARGMTALTGETGAGKTLLVEALAAVVGGRIGASAVRSGAQEAVIEARFEGSPEAMDGGEPERSIDEAEGARRGEETAETVLARSLPREGRTRCWIDGRMSTVAALAEVGAAYVDIHGQHEQQSLLRPAGQRRALDAFGRLNDRPVQEGRRRLRAIEREIAELGGSPSERAQQLDLLQFQVEEITNAAIQGPDEDERLRGEEEVLANLEAHREALREALALLGGGHLPDEGAEGTGAVERVGEAAAALGNRDRFSAWRSRLDGVVAELDDLATDLRTALESWDLNPARLAEVQARRKVLADLRRKHGGDLGDVLAFATAAEQRMAELRDVEDRLEALAARRDQEENELRRQERELREARASAAARLASSVDQRLHGLAMPGASLRVEVAMEAAGDDVRFQLAANPGEPPKPLSQVASGGELARCTLALRLLTPGGPPTVLFDEVDAGVGGEAALALAAALRELGETRQVLVVTHLPQVAAFADHHVVVAKSLSEGRTVTECSPVSGADRVVELARMLSGHPESATARAHATELLDLGRRSTPSTSAGSLRR